MDRFPGQPMTPTPRRRCIQTPQAALQRAAVAQPQAGAEVDRGLATGTMSQTII